MELERGFVHGQVRSCAVRVAHYPSYEPGEENSTVLARDWKGWHFSGIL